MRLSASICAALAVLMAVFRHLLIGGNLSASYKSRFMFRGRDSRVGFSLLVDANDKMRLARALLGDEE